MPTIPEIINIAKVSQYVASNSIAKRGLFGGGTNLKIERLLYLVRKNVEWAYGNDTGYTDIHKTSNYLYALCGEFSLEASRILANSIAGNNASVANTFFGVYLIPVTSTDFASATVYNNPLIVGKQLVIFWNDIPRYLTGAEFTQTTTGIVINVSGFDSTVNTYQLYIYIVNPG